MGIKNTHGFTIIEVMLFLGVTGVLAVGILAGSGVAINQQRYRDSVSTLKSFMQQQYNQATNVSNGRNGDESCTNASVVQPPTNVPNPQARGTSDCLLMGRMITVGEDGKKLTASNVVGYRTSVSAPVEATDLAELTTNYQLGVSEIDQEETSVEWNAQVVKPKTTTLYPLSILIIRSPLSGSMMTFVDEGVQTDPSAMVVGGVTTGNTDMCVNASPGSFVGERLAVRINAYASAQSSVEIPSESDHICEQ